MAVYTFKDHKFGDTFDGVSFTVNVNASPLDLTGASIKAEFRANSKTGPVVKTVEVGTGFTITDAANGVFQMDPFEIDIPVGVNLYDIEITLSDSRVKTYIEGTWCILQDITA